MKYTTTNEWEHFGFAEAYLSDIQKRNGCFQLTLDNVTIYPENSKNRDIRPMRANELNLKIQDGTVESLIEEGYKVYNADGKLLEQHEDAAVPPQQYNDVLKSFCDGECCLYSLKKENGRYVFEIDASNERTYLLCVSGTRDVEEWERFLSKE